MVRFRLVLAWLVMFAIPLQGIAATTMLFCAGGPAHHHAQLQSAPHHASGAEHDHATHQHAQAKAGDVDSPAATMQLPAQTHKCGVCASCCHSVAIAEGFHPLTFAALPQTDPPESFVPVHSRPAVVLDKPPRG